MTILAQSTVILKRLFREETSFGRLGSLIYRKWPLTPLMNSSYPCLIFSMSVILFAEMHAKDTNGIRRMSSIVFAHFVAGQEGGRRGADYGADPGESPGSRKAKTNRRGWKRTMRVLPPSRPSGLLTAVITCHVDPGRAMRPGSRLDAERINYAGEGMAERARRRGRGGLLCSVDAGTLGGLLAAVRLPRGELITQDAHHALARFSSHADRCTALRARPSGSPAAAPSP